VADFGGPYSNFFLDRYGVAVQPSDGALLPAKSCVRLVQFAPDGEADFDGEKAQAAQTPSPARLNEKEQ
jgi:hypothetical protein